MNQLKEVSDEMAATVNKIFNYFFGIFPSTYSVFRNQEDLHHSKRVWMRALLKVGLMKEDGLIDKDRINRGLDCLHYLNQPFMPSAGQFITLCFQGLENDNFNEGRVQKDNIQPGN